MIDFRRLSHSFAKISALALALSLWQPPQTGPARAEQGVAATDQPAARGKAPEPSPQLTPEGVVKCQISELSAAGDVADRIERCYRFASPNNKEYTGPIKRFSEMVQSPPYDALLSAKHFLVGRSTRDKDQAHLLLSVVNQQNELILFRCFLSKQTAADFKDCWMTDAVVPIGKAQQPAPPERKTAPSI